MKTRKFSALALAVIMCLSLLSVSAAATDQPAIQPFWANVSTASSTLSISGTMAKCAAAVTCLSGTTEIDSTLKLYRQIGTTWYLVKTWSNDVSATSVTYSETYTVTTGYNYKLVVEVDAYRNGVWENVSKESSIVYCG